MWTICFCFLCLGIGLSSAIQQICFRVASDKLTATVRERLFVSIIKKNIAWFDSQTRATGILTNFLTQEVTFLNGLTAESMGIFLEALFGVTVSCLICFIFSW